MYVLERDRDALLIDTGSDTVMRHLAEIGVDRVNWVLHTHHHRDQCWGTKGVQNTGAKLAVPKFEKHLFDNVEAYWQARVIYDNYNNMNTFFSLGDNIAADAALEEYSNFVWTEYEIFVLPAKGHTYGMVSLVTRVNGQKVAFTGDLMTPGGNLNQLHAMEYAYGDLAGVEFTMQSILALKKENVSIAYPSHGGAISDVRADIERLERKLEQLANIGRLFTSGWNTGSRIGTRCAKASWSAFRITCFGQAHTPARTFTSCLAEAGMRC
ncbi:MBL fold metallo-hydrolase [Bradyrhizobium sp. Arg314]